jgi:hypothetical protein
MKSTIFWDITLRSPLSVNRRFGRTYSLHLHGRKNKLSKKVAWKQVASLEAMFLRNIGWHSMDYTALYPGEILIICKMNAVTPKTVCPHFQHISNMNLYCSPWQVPLADSAVLRSAPQLSGPTREYLCNCNITHSSWLQWALLQVNTWHSLSLFSLYINENLFKNSIH